MPLPAKICTVVKKKLNGIILMHATFCHTFQQYVHFSPFFEKKTISKEYFRDV